MNQDHVIPPTDKPRPSLKLINQDHVIILTDYLKPCKPLNKPDTYLKEDHLQKIWKKQLTFTKWYDLWVKGLAVMQKHLVIFKQTRSWQMLEITTGWMTESGRSSELKSKDIWPNLTLSKSGVCCFCQQNVLVFCCKLKVIWDTIYKVTKAKNYF